ncbi:alpha/beta hydrolase [Nocardia yamanashiensis]|uniref:alpha/beta hydrolase n=1 Tax=Nocardia yamanashiensis TaxID=209247 RepID=UPI001E292F8C|nr:alpha/beta hydrolase [Nocardia yamanashiensis]UGT44175.1 alpha/beta hydrolase [Nocardia yamanashiensis]
MTAPQVPRFAFGDVDITALAWGDPGDPAALLIHGFPDSAWTWEVLGPELAARGYYAVAPFTRGYAPTTLARDDDYSIGALVADVVRVHDAIGADARAVLIGHDWGGAIVSAASSSHPELFRRAVLIAIPPLATIKALLTSPRQLPTMLRQAPRSWYMPVVSVPYSETIGRWLISLLWRLWAPSADLAEHRRRGLLALQGGDRIRAAFTYYRAVWNPWYRRGSAHARTQRLAFGSPRNPTLVLQGATDTCGLPATGAGALAQLPPGSRRIVVADAGHFAHLEQPAAVTGHILEYLKDGTES